MSLREQLQEIYDAHNVLTPSLVVNTARDPEHPLHSRFEWDDAVAGERWRQAQAHELIRSVRVVYKKAEGKESAQSVRAFHAVQSPNGFVYEPVEKVTADPLLAQMVLRDMEREWKQLKDRYGHFRQFYDMVRDDVDEAQAA